MVALQIRDVPDGVRDALASQAASRGQSLQAFLLELVTDQAAREANAEIIAKAASRRGGTSLPPGAVLRAIDDAREGRDERMRTR